jgi:outer membrane protein TolC
MIMEGFMRLMMFMVLLLGSAATLKASDAEEMKVTLGEVLRVALEKNLDIELQKLQVDSSKIQFKMTRTAYEPKVGGTISLESKDRAPTNSNEGNAGQTITDKGTSYNMTFSKTEDYGMSWQAGLNARANDSGAVNSFGNYYTAYWMVGVEQNILKGFSFDREIRLKDEYLAKGNLRLSKLDLEMTMINVMSQTELAYWDLVKSIENKIAMETSLELAKQLYQQNKTKIEIGTLAPIELVYAESNVAAKESTLISAENAVKQNEDVLRKIMNLPDSKWDMPIRPVDTPSVQILEVSKQKAFELAFHHRAELEKQQIMDQNEKLDYKYYQNQRLPDLKFKANYSSAGSSYPTNPNNSQSEAISNAFSRQFPGFNMELALTWTPFNKFNDLKIAESKLKLRQRELEMEQTHKTIREEVRGALRELDSAEKSIKATQKTRKYREDSLAAEIQKFQNGLTTNYQVAEVQDQLTQAIFGEIQAKTDYRKALVSYYKAVGQLVETHGIRVVD